MRSPSTKPYEPSDFMRSIVPRTDEHHRPPAESDALEHEHPPVRPRRRHDPDGALRLPRDRRPGHLVAATLAQAGRLWVTLLDELTMQLATGLLYNRDLPTIDDPMRNLVDHYLRRVDGSKR